MTRSGVGAAALAFFLLAGAAGAAGPQIDGLAWMAGTWTGTDAGVEMEEIWTAPKGGSMLGMHRDVAGGKTQSFEFLRIDAGADGITYWASPRGRPATPFRLAKAEGRSVTFENPQHDYPTRILYWLADDGALHAKIEGTAGDKPAAEEWTWQRAR